VFLHPSGIEAKALRSERHAHHVGRLAPVIATEELDVEMARTCRKEIVFVAYFVL